MKQRIAVAVLLAAALVAVGCQSHTQMPAPERAALERELTGREAEKFLRLSYYVVPFFGDASKRLLSHLPPDELRMLNHPDGTPVNPGEPEGILPAGRRVRIQKVEFPTSWVVTERIPYTPRTQPWVYLQIQGAPAAYPYVLVLRQGIQTHEEFLTELGRYLSDRDPSATLQGFGERVQEAVKTKTAIPDMPQEALEMAWGYPELIKKELDGDTRRETWAYPGRKRQAHLVDGRVVRVETGQ
jgi:hypothetical protein